MTTEIYLVACKKAKLSVDDMTYMTVGMCIDYAMEYFDSFNQKKEPNVRKGTQADFDRFRF